MLRTIYKIAYNPNISGFFRNKLKLLAPSMVSEDGSTAQYNVEYFIQSLDGEELSIKEQAFLEELINNNIDYIEI